MKTIAGLSASVAALTLLGACSGGGGTNSPGSAAPAPSPIAPAPTPTPTPAPTPTPTPAPTPTPPAYPAPVSPPAGYVITPSGQQPVRSANDTTEFRRNYGANEFVNALYALDSGHDGHGVTVAVIDNGARNMNGELDGRISSLSRDFGDIISGGNRTPRNQIGDEHSDHGTPVANIIAANANGTGTVGYAPGAQLAVLRISDWNADTQTETLVHAAEALDYAGSKAIKLVNVSLSSGGSSYWGDAVARFARTGGLVVNSAGNSSGSDPIDAPAITTANRNAILFVGALSPNINAYQLEPYSNRAGVMKDRYVVAVGSNVTTSVDGATVIFSGTSSAAPVVSALAADILSKWPQLSGQQAGDIILNTARDIGDPGVDTVYGHGLVDFKAALSPINPTLSNGTAQASLQASVMTVPEAIRVTAIRAALSHVTVLDEYGRDFSGSIAGMVVQPHGLGDRRIERRVRQLGNQTALAWGGFTGSMGFATWRIGPNGDDVRSAPLAGSFGYAADGFGVRAAWNAADSLQSDLMGLAPFADGILAYVPQADTSLALDRYFGGGRLSLTVNSGRNAGSRAQAVSLGWSRGRTDLRVALIDESGTLLGIPTGSGALRLGRGASTVMVEAHRTFAIADRWTIEGYGSLGFTRLKIDPQSLVTSASPILGSRLGIQANGTVLGGLFSVGIAQPLMIETGSARLTYGNGYDLQLRALTYATARASLTGERRLQLTAGYAAGGPRASFRLGVMQDVRDGSTSALAGWSRRF